MVWSLYHNNILKQEWRDNMIETFSREIMRKEPNPNYILGFVMQFLPEPLLEAVSALFLSDRDCAEIQKIKLS